MRCFHGGYQWEIFWDVGLQIATKLFLTLFLTAEAQLAYHLSAEAPFFLGTLEFHGEFYEIEFDNSIQDWVITTVYQL